MRPENDIQVTFQVEEVKAAEGRLMLAASVRLELPQPTQDHHLPHDVERMVEDVGQQFKRWAYRQLMEQLDAELTVAARRGTGGQGVVCRGFREGTFKTVFGTVKVPRHRLEDKADGTLETPAAVAWGTPQQVTITQGLIDAVCDAMLQEPSRKALRSVEERAGEEGLLARTSVLNLVHEEGRQLREAARRRAEAVFAADPQAACGLLPRVAEPPPEEEPPPIIEDEAEPWAALTGFRGAPPNEAVEEQAPRRVDADTVMVQADDVEVDAQASTGCKEIRVYNAVVSTAEQTWCFSEEDSQHLRLVVGALLAVLGVHRGGRRLLFVNDGARWIRDWFDALQVEAKSMVLCWYHLARRCLGDLGSACGKRRAKELGKEVLDHLWKGRVDEALEVLLRHRTEMKNRPALDQLVEYLRARRPYLPDYRARHEAGVWIASNRVEKLNDWTTSQRCKNRGMDWTRDGVVALAVLESARRNGELASWRCLRVLPAWKSTHAVDQAA
jgi:hypothetical protein